jgi:hypothetical protein
LGVHRPGVRLASSFSSRDAAGVVKQRAGRNRLSYRPESSYDDANCEFSLNGRLSESLTTLFRVGLQEPGRKAFRLRIFPFHGVVWNSDSVRCTNCPQSSAIIGAMLLPGGL